MSEGQVERRGRKTAEEEARSYLEKLGLDPDLVLAGTPDDRFPETPEEMRDAFMRILWSKRNTLTDTAFTQALNAIGKWMADAEQSGDAAAEEWLIADMITGIPGLATERRREILERALVELDGERAAIVEALDVVPA